MALAKADAREKANNAVLAALAFNGLEAALAASSGATSRMWVAAALTAATYAAVYRNFGRNVTATRNAAMGLAAVHAVLAAAFIPVHQAFFLEAAVAGCLIWAVKEIKDGGLA
jgi:threonine/homoserine efflux transporter RhtA